MPLPSLIVSLGLVAAVSTLVPVSTVSATQVEAVSLGNGNVLLPTPEGFSQACKESPRFAAGIAAMTPKDSKLLSCWVESTTWAALQSGKGQSAYPAMFVTLGYGLGSSWSATDFEHLKSLARQNLGKSIPTSGKAAQAEVERQNTELARQSIPIQSSNLQSQFNGFFDSSDKSFSYLSTREYNLTAKGGPQVARETLAITTILEGGNVLTYTVVETGITEQSATHARDLALQWLRQYRSANSQ